ncbi:hypothetical protein SUGI_0787210 [Cryptomeria japonica]|nr:hypothetical protein SUGI_0787210 [Cryptomeria japonica]
MGRDCREWVRGSVIGVGSFGTVSQALDKATGELLAVKSVECTEERRVELVAMENEIRILRKMDSPWFVKFMGENYCEDGGLIRRDLLMEYMAGGSVADVIQRFGGQLEESLIRVYTRGIVKGIEYLHNQGIVHCDIKGKNVLVGNCGVKLADFGFAKDMVSEGESSVQWSGTPLWMAPEVVNQVEGGSPCDIWYLGCTVVEMATGRPPWTNISHPLAAMYKIGCSDELPEFPKSLSAEGRDFLEKCFRRDPKQRWTSAQLLGHPFLNDCVQQRPPSPISTLNFHNAENQCNESNNSGTFSGSIPQVTLYGNLPKSPQEEQARHNNSEVKRMSAERPRPSPSQRVAELAEKIVGASNSSANKPNWCLTPTSNWIVVRSISKPPLLDTLFTDFINESSAQSTPSTQNSQADYNSTSQNSKLSNYDPSLTRSSANKCNDPSGSHGFCNSIAHLTDFCKELAAPESSPEIVDIHKRKQGIRDLNHSRLNNKLLKFLMNIFFYPDTILQLMLLTRLGQNCTRLEAGHWKPKTSLPDDIYYSIIRTRVDSSRNREKVSIK